METAGKRKGGGEEREGGWDEMRLDEINKVYKIETP